MSRKRKISWPTRKADKSFGPKYFIIKNTKQSLGIKYSGALFYYSICREEKAFQLAVNTIIKKKKDIDTMVFYADNNS